MPANSRWDLIQCLRVKLVDAKKYASWTRNDNYYSRCEIYIKRNLLRR
jgi:hypothetical protein